MRLQDGYLHHYELPKDEQYCWVIVVKNEDHPSWRMDRTHRIENAAKREILLSNIIRAGLAVRTHVSYDLDEYYILIGAPQRYMELVATRMQIPIESTKILMVPDRLTGGVRAERRVYHKPFDLSSLSDFVVDYADFVADSDGVDDGAANATQAKPVIEKTFRFANREEIEIVGYCLFSKWQPDANSYGADIDQIDMVTKGHVQAIFPRRGQKNNHLKYLKVSKCPSHDTHTRRGVTAVSHGWH